MSVEIVMLSQTNIYMFQTKKNHSVFHTTFINNLKAFIFYVRNTCVWSTYYGLNFKEQQLVIKCIMDSRPIAYLNWNTPPPPKITLYSICMHTSLRLVDYIFYIFQKIIFQCFKVFVLVYCFCTSFVLLV